MKKIFLSILLFFSTTCWGYSPIALVGNAVNGNAESPTTATASMTMTANNLIVVGVTENSNGAGCTNNLSVSDGVNTYFVIGQQTQNFNCTEIFIAKNIVGGSNTITVTDSTSSRYFVFVAAQFSGADLFIPFDKPSLGKANGSTTTITSSTFTTQLSSELTVAVASNYYHGTTFTAGTVNSVNMTIPTGGSTTSSADGQPPQIALEYLVEGASLSGTTASMGLSQGSSNYNADIVVASFKQLGAIDDAFNGQVTMQGQTVIN